MTKKYLLYAVNVLLFITQWIAGIWTATLQVPLRTIKNNLEGKNANTRPTKKD